MYNFLLGLHNSLRWIILLLLVINLVRHFMAINKPFGETDKKLGLFLMIFTHIQLLIGLYQWFAGPWGLQNFMINGSEVMKNSTSRFFCSGTYTKHVDSHSINYGGEGYLPQATS